jgi:hypothetical protein
MDAMLLLQGDRLLQVYDGFRKVFDDEGRGLTLHEFVAIFSENVEKGIIDPLPLAKMLAELFRHIDINGDKVRK